MAHEMRNMNNILKKDMLRILTKVIVGIKQKDTYLLSKTSNEINHSSSIFQDEDSLTIAVVVYAISKIIDRNNSKMDPQFEIMFRKAKQHMQTNNFDKYRDVMRGIVSKINDVDSRMKQFVLDVYNQAEIKKGSKIFSNGISLARVAELMNLSQWELMNYVGKTNIPEMFQKDRHLKERLGHARSLFNL